jgi:O-antigen/teichoic acid export membrane protein
MLHKRSIKDKLLKGGVWAFAGKVVTALSGLAVSALLARLLTPEEMGAYFLTFSLVSVVAIIAQLGLTQTIVRLVAESMGTDRPGRARQSVILALRVVAFSGLVVACLLAFGAGQWIAEHFFSSKIMAQVMGLAAVWVVIITFQSLMAEVYRGFHDIRLATILGGLTTSVLSMGLFLALWLIQGKSNLDQIVALTLGSGLSSVFLSSAILWNKLSRLPSEKNKIDLTEVLKTSWPLWVTNITLFILVQVDLWIMGVFRSPEEVAVYGAASRIVALVAMPLLIVNAVVPPLIAEMYAQRKIIELEAALRMVATLTGLPSLIILGALVLFGDSILGAFFGEYYQTGGAVLAVLSIGQLANVWAGSCGLTLMLTGHQSTMMAITVTCGAFTAILAWFLVSRYEGLGVAIAASSGMILQNILMLLFAKNSIGVWTHVNPMLINRFRGIKE